MLGRSRNLSQITELSSDLGFPRVPYDFGDNSKNFPDISIFIEMYVILISMNIEITTLSFRALGDPTRMRIVEFLSKCCCGQVSVHEDGGVESPSAGEICCHITGAEKITSTISHHLHELEKAELVAIEKRGKTALCSLKPEALRELASHLDKLASGTCEENGHCSCS